MTPSELAAPEEWLAAWLRACDDALASGEPAAVPSPPPDCDPDDPVWGGALACLRLLDQLRPRTPGRGPGLTGAAGALGSGGHWLLHSLRSSGLIDAAVLDAWSRSAAPDPQATPAAVADHLVRDALLTRYQADRLLAGGAAGLVLGGRYRVLDRLGGGGAGEVYLCSHAVMRHRVAVKVLPPGRSAESLAGFRREARAVAALDHPHIVRAYDIDADGSTHYLVMEYVEGRTLHQVVRADGPLDPHAAAGYVSQVATALQHAHERGLVHRDVKPANLIVGAAGAVKVLDLGLARFLKGGDGTEPSSLVGTADYMAPEQSLAGPGGDARADIYSLGCTLYFLLTGRAPFEDKPVAGKLLCHQLRAPQPLRSLRPGVPPGLAAVVDRMTAKNPAERYQTAAGVAAALRPWAEATRPPPRPAQARRLTPALALTVLLAASSAGGWWHFRRAPDAALPHSPEGQLEAVTTRLRELNPQYDGDLGGMAYRMADDVWVVSSLRIGGGRVTHLSLLTDQVSDISPLGELKSLTHLMMRDSPASGNTGRVTDLGPLRGLPLEALECSGNAGLSDLTPLRGMPLEELAVGGTAVEDLSPLAGMPLRKLFCGESRVADLSPLKGAPLTALSVRYTAVTSLEPLRGAPLEVMRCEGSGVTDLSPLAGSRLRALNCQGTPLGSLAPLAGLPLEDLHFDYDPVRDRDVRRYFPALVRVNGQPADEFWAAVAPPPVPPGGR